MLISFILWLLVMVGNLFGFLTAPVIFPLAYATRNIGIFRKYIFWIYYDDEDGFGYEVDWWMEDKPAWNFWTAYKWAALRNPAWNLQAATVLSQQVVGHLQPTRVLKYVNSKGEYTDNKGEFLSLKHSKLGSVWETFKWGWFKLWRYSYAGPLYKNFYVELQIGFQSRPTFRLKFKPGIKVFETWKANVQ